MNEKSINYVETGVAELIASPETPSPKEVLTPEEYDMFRAIHRVQVPRVAFPDPVLIYPDDIVQIWLKGRAERKKGSYRSAIKHFEIVASKLPLFVENRLNLAFAYIVEGRLADAAQQYHEVLALGLEGGIPVAAAVIANASLADVYLEMALRSEQETERIYRLTLAIHCAERSTALKGADSPDVLADWTVALLHLGQVAEAAHIWKRAQIADPNREILSHKLAKYPELNQCN